MNAPLIPSKDGVATGATPQEKCRIPFEHTELVAWRRKATDLTLAASAMLHVPLLALFFLGYRSSASTTFSAYFTAASLVILWAALFRGIDYRVRAWIVLADLYVTSLIGSFAFPGGPYMRTLPVVAPVFAISLLGIRPALIATGFSAVVLVGTPPLLAIPELSALLGVAAGRPGQPDTGWLQGAALMTNMSVLMVLLVMLNRFLLRSLKEQATALGHERSAYRLLESETQARLTLEREITRIGDDERHRIGSEIHDGICQQITGALLRCQALELRLEGKEQMPGADLRALSSLLSETLDEARAVAQGLRPIGTNPRGLTSALRRLVRRTEEEGGVPCAFLVSGDVLHTDPVVAQHLYRIAQEALHNAARHAGAGRIALTLQGDDDTLTLRVEDDGRGFPADSATEGMGLLTMTYRAEILGGDFRIESDPGMGTRVTCRVARCRHAADPEAPEGPTKTPHHDTSPL